ncbi:hypothetical protein ACJJTC_014467 [Scirpophaga incertulas]
MESHIHVPSPTHQNIELKQQDSPANFQKFLFDLFEQNGIINDLRAYLRGHIINVLKNAQIGELPGCQKHFTQRLDLFYQGVNMLIAEYLLRLDFNYSLSVFVTEIPLANMMLGFAKKLMHSSNGDIENLKFKENDIWSILNYIGVKCDSEYVSHIAQKYYNGNDPLLLCLLNTCIGHHQWNLFNKENASSSSISSGTNSNIIQTDINKTYTSKTSAFDDCHHVRFCKKCQLKVTRLKEKYKRKKKYLEQNAYMDGDQLKVNIIMKNIGVIEKSIIDELFEQLKNIYEKEVDMIREGEEKKLKRSELELQKRMEEMEKSFMIREQELEKNIQDKKKFLWGLARALREQHAQMARAMSAVRHEADNLTAKEDTLKTQITDAEKLLKKKGEEMRAQISNELMILENHFESMKKEREEVCRERKQLEELKSSETMKLKDFTKEDFSSQYNTLKEDLMTIKKHFETIQMERKCTMERSTLTEPSDVMKTNVLNNEQDADRNPLKSDSDNMIGNPNKLVNDLKKKNVNFHPQREHIDELSSHRAKLQAEMTAARFLAEYPVPTPSTILTVMPNAGQITRFNPSSSAHSVGWPKGGGEEVSRFVNFPPRVLNPEDQVPFIGRADSTRHLINQWRSLRRRVSPVTAGRYSNPAIMRERTPQGRHATSTPVRLENEGAITTTDDEKSLHLFTHERTKTPSNETQQPEVKSTKSVLRQAKEKLKNYVQEHPNAGLERKTPDSVLREAKLRLRKLEIEAEAVEKSYLDFRKRQAELNGRQEAFGHFDVNVKSQSNGRENCAQNYEHTFIKKINKNNKKISNNTSSEQKDIGVALSRINYENSNVSSVKPVPKTFFNIESKLKQSDKRREYYLETPLIEFRKLYHSERAVTRNRIPDNDKIKAAINEDRNINSTQNGDNFTNKVDELEALQDVCESIDNNDKINKTDLVDCDDKVDPQLIENKTDKINEHASDINVSDQFSNKFDVDIPQNENVIKENKTVLDQEQSLTGTSNSQLLLEIETSTDTREIDLPNSGGLRTEMVIIASPKATDNVEPNSTALESKLPVIAKVSENNDTDKMLDVDSINVHSSVEIELNLSEEKVMQTRELEENISAEIEPISRKENCNDINKIADIEDDYADDFAVEVDNNSDQSNYESHSPISLLNNSKTDNFWDS